MTSEEAYRHCARMARDHYENFPVASWTLPARLRRPVAAVYAFARTADDFADEGNRSPAERLQNLARLDSYLDAGPERYQGSDPMLLALSHAVAAHGLPIAPLKDLLRAFRADVTKGRYRNFGEVMAYCRCSANPVGRLMLHLFGNTSERALAHSDAVCSALQLINFLQDLREDLNQRDRLYVPQDEMTQYGVAEAELASGTVTPAVKGLIAHQGQRAMKLLRAGAPLGTRLRGRIGLELRLIVVGGARILQAKLDAFDEPYLRPRLAWHDWPILLWRASCAYRAAL